MKEIIITTVKIVRPLAVAPIVFAQGLKIFLAEVAAYFEDRVWLILRSLLAVLVLAPAAVLGIIRWLEPAREVAIGLALLVARPPAPMMIEAGPKLGKGSVAFMARLHLSLASAALFTVPIGLSLLSITLGFHANVDLLKMGGILAGTILLPFAVVDLLRRRNGEETTQATVAVA